jgi:hypothetical protein
LPHDVSISIFIIHHTILPFLKLNPILRNFISIASCVLLPTASNMSAIKALDLPIRYMSASSSRFQAR